MQYSEGTKNWLRLAALTIVSGLALLSYSYTATRLTGTKPFENSFSPFIWIVPLIGFGLTSLTFIFSFSNVVLRNAALRGIAVAAVMGAPLLGFNFIQLTAHFPGHTGSFSLFHIFSLAVCLLITWGLSHWRATDSKTERLSPDQPVTSRTLFWALVYLLLLVPFFSTQMAIDSTYELTKLPMDNSSLPHEAVAQSKVLQQDFVSALTHSMTRIIERSQGILALIIAVALLHHAQRASRQGPAIGISAPFPSRQDTLLLVIFMTSAVVFAISCQVLAEIPAQVAQTLKSVSLNDSLSVEHIRISTLSVDFLPGITFVVSGLIIASRLFRAPELQVIPCLLLLFCSLALMCESLCDAIPGLLWIGYAALITFVIQCAVFFWRRKAWKHDFAPKGGRIALESAQWGALSLSLLGGPLYTIAIVMAFVSVSDISYLLSWSETLKSGGHAPLDKIFPLFAPNLLPTAFMAGPAFFTLCLFVTSTASLLLSLIYVGAQGCAQGFLAFRHMLLKQKPKLPASSRVTVWPTAPTP
jgi:hypothetical protein